MVCTSQTVYTIQAPVSHKNFTLGSKAKEEKNKRSELFIPESHCHFFYSIPFSFGVKGGVVERICFIFFFNLVSSLEFLDRPGKVKKAHLLV